MISGGFVSRAVLLNSVEIYTPGLFPQVRDCSTWLPICPAPPSGPGRQSQRLHHPGEQKLHALNLPGTRQAWQLQIQEKVADPWHATACF
jgi:hypothetical protein